MRAPVTLWWGERDVVCPPSIARVYEERLPDATLRLTDDTHQILFSRWRELLADVRARPSATLSRLDSPLDADAYCGHVC